MIISDLRVQNLKNPIGIGTVNPVLSWKLSSSVKNQKQTAYQIVASSTTKKLEDGEYNIWDSKKVNDSKNYSIEYNGAKPGSMERVYWKVKIWDADHKKSDWSETAYWEMGLLNAQDWKGKWITRGEESVIDKLRSGLTGNVKHYAPILSKEFYVSKEKTVSSVRLYISGLGLYEAHMNGTVIGEGTYFNPGESDVRDTVYYGAYDLTHQINCSVEKGYKNAISFILGNGQYANYRIHRQSGRYYKTDDARSEAEVEGMFGQIKGIAQIAVTYDDGMTELIGTDDTWSFIESPITENSWYGGEDYNAMLEIKGWNNINPEISRNSWGTARIVADNIPKGILTAREFEPIGIINADTIHSEDITVTKVLEENHRSTYLVDMGRNGAGFPEITIDTNKAGAKITMYPAEVNTFDGYEGHINQASCTQSDSNHGNLIYNTYITKGSKKEVYHPTFCYHGYRYLEVTAPSDIPLTNKNFKGYLLRTLNEKKGSFSSSDETLNRINTLTERSIESNMFHTFTDCPQIEKLGWIETPGLMFYSMAHTYDISSWIPKLIQDMVDAQYENGRIAAIAPEYFKIGTLYEDLNWNGSIIFTAWQYYESYKNPQVFGTENYKAMKRYMTYLESDVAVNHLITTGHMGEWGEMTNYGTTPKVLVETTAYYRLAVTMSKIASVLENEKDTIYYENLAGHIQKAFHENSTCYNKEHLYGNGTQSSYGCVIYSGIVLDENLDEAVKRLVESIRKVDYHLTSGEVGLKQVFSALAENGHSNIVYEMVMNDSMPSYKYFVHKGLTTLPEYWNFEDLWGSVARSLNHAMMGHVKEWFTRYLAGIDFLKPGYDKIIIKPSIISKLSEVRGAIHTVHGNISSGWNYNSDTQKLVINITIPVGVTAKIYIPKLSKKQKVFSNDREVSVTLSKDENYFIVNEDYGSGNYEFTN